MKTRYIADLHDELMSRKIGRRQFVTAAVAAGVALPAALSMTDAVLAATPKKGGRLRQGFSAGSTTETLDALKSSGSVVEICNNWCWGSNLTEVQPDGSIGPELAESIEASEKGRTWVFRLRKGVTFHNGKSLTPEDVIDSVNRHRGEDSASAVASLFASIVEMRKDGDDQVVIKLNAPNADFPFLLSDYRLVIMASDGNGNVDTTSGNGTGPVRHRLVRPRGALLLQAQSRLLQGGSGAFRRDRAPGDSRHGGAPERPDHRRGRRDRRHRAEDGPPDGKGVRRA